MEAKMNNEVENLEKEEGIGQYIFNIVLSMIFPFMVLWYGPKYLFNGKYLKGILIILIVATEFIILGKIRGIF